MAFSSIVLPIENAGADEHHLLLNDFWYPHSPLSPGAHPLVGI